MSTEALPVMPEPEACRVCGEQVILVRSARSMAPVKLDVEPIGGWWLVARVRHIHPLVATDGAKHLDDPVAAEIPVRRPHRCGGQ
jgi:hypothetical protein